MLKLKLQYFGCLMQTTVSFEKTLKLGKIEPGGEKRMTEMDGHLSSIQKWMTDWMASPTQWNESESTPGVVDEQGGLVCCSPWDRKESDMTEQLN